jgi:hypothetical protein
MSTVEFNASIQVTELLMRTLENAAKDLATRCIKECATKYDFNAEEAIQALGLESLSVIRKQMAKKSVSKERVPKERVAKEKKSSIPMPFTSEGVDLTGCQGLAYNRGLFTQCAKKPMENGNYCKGCQSEADKNASGCPDCGTVESRQNSSLYEFKDPKGRKPTHYLKVLEKLKINTEQASSEAAKLQICIDEAHLNAPEKSQNKPKGRPKKVVAKVEAENMSDLFAQLIEDKNGEEILEVVEDNAEEEKKEAKSPKNAKLSEEEKAAKKAALEAERAAKKAEREAKAAEEKAEREAKRKAEVEQKKAEREAKAAEEKAEREAKREAEKAEREAKRQAEKAEREAKREAEKATKKPAAKASKAAKAEEADKADKAEEPAKAEESAKVTVSKTTINGKIYLKSSVNILYDPATKEEVGLWDPESKTIKPLPNEDEEEDEEDGYESV